jgi:hypothetical protein
MKHTFFYRYIFFPVIIILLFLFVRPSTAYAANRYFVSSATNCGGTWADTDCWSTTSGGGGGQAVPTTSDDVYIDDKSCTGACTTVTAGNPVNAHNLNFTNFTKTYNASSRTHNITGDLTVVSGMTFTYGTSTMSFSGGSAQNLTAAGKGFYAVTINNTGGVTLYNDITIYSSLTNTAGGFSVSGTPKVTMAGSTSVNLNASTSNNITLYDLEINKSDAIYIRGYYTTTVTHNLTLTEGYFRGGTSGVISVQGDISVASAFGNGNDSYHAGVIVQASGGASQQLSGSGYLPALTIAKTAGTEIALQNDINIVGSFVYTSGTFTHNNHKVTLDSVSSTYATPTLNGGGVSLYDLEINIADTYYVVVTNSTIVTHTLTLTEGALDAGTSGNIQVTGDISLASTFNTTTLRNDGLITMNGSSTQYISTTGGAGGSLPSLTLNNSTGSITFNNDVSVTGNFTYSGGTVNFGTTKVTLDSGVDGMDLNANGLSFYDLEIASTIDAMGQDVTGTIIVTHNLTLTEGDLDNQSNGVITAQGDVYVGANAGRSNATNDATVSFTGSNSQTLYVTTGGKLPKVIINKTNATDVVDVSGSAQTVDIYDDFTITEGIFDLNGNNLTCESTCIFANNDTLRLYGTETVTFSEGTGFDENSGTVIFDGSGTFSSGLPSGFGNYFYNVTFDNASGEWQLGANLRADATLTINAGTLTQGAWQVRAVGVVVGASGIWSDLSTGDILVGTGNVANAGTVIFKASDACGGTDEIAITAISGTPQWSSSGAGTYTMWDVSVTGQNAASAITVYSGTNGGSNTGSWTFNASCPSSGITITGVIRQANESSAYDCSAVTAITVYASVNGGGNATADCTDADGNYSITTLTDPGGANIPVAVFISSGEGIKGTTVTLSAAAATNITNLDIYVDRLVVTQESATALTNSHLATADNADDGIRYSVASGDLTVESGIELHVKSSKTFAPGDNVNTPKLHVVGTYTGGSEILTLSGSGTGTSRPLYINGGTFTPTSNTVNFTGTSETDLESGFSYYNLGAGTTADSSNVSFNLGGSTTVTHVLTVGATSGTGAHTLVAGSNTLTLSGTDSPMVVNTQGSFSSGTGTVSFENTTSATVPGLTYNNLQFNPASGTPNYTLGDIGDWYNTSWLYRVKVTILASQVDADLTDYPVYVNLADLPSGFHSHVNQTDGRDIRVTKADGVTELPREVVFYNSSTDTGEVHFKYTGTLSGTVDSDVYIYYGNSGASDYASSDTYGKNNVWTNSYKAVWHLNEASGSHYDSTSNAVTGTVTGSPQGGTGKIGKSDNITASSMHVDVSKTNYWNFAGGDTVTIEAWTNFSADTSGTYGNILGSASMPAFQFKKASAGNYRLAWVNGGTEYQSSTTSSYSVGTGTWYLVSMQKNGTSGINFYRNGSQIGTTVSNTGETGTNGTNVEIGNDGSTEWINGLVDEVRVSTTNRASTWLSTEYNNQNSSSTFYSVDNETSKPSSATITVGGNLTITGSGTATVDAETNDPNIDIAGNFVIGTGDTFLASSTGDFTIAGNWSNSGNFTANSGTVTLDGAGSTTQEISGTTSFYNLYATTATTRTLQFAASTVYTITNNLTLTGTSCSALLTLRSSSSAQWSLDDDSGGTTSVDYVDVQYSNASDQPITAAHGVNGGNNSSWTITAVCSANNSPGAPTILFVNERATTAQIGVTNPITVGDPTPVFSSIYNDADTGDIANKYEIVVYSDASCTAQVWDSGSSGTTIANCTQGNRCVDKTFAGTPLQFDGAEYYWKMKYWDDDGAEGSFSDCTATFTILGPGKQLRHGHYFFNSTTERMFSW